MLNNIKNENYLLDFTHVYDDEISKTQSKLKWLDCSDIQESNMYCSEKAAEQIGRCIERYGIRGIHYIDNGNYHYITKLMTDRIKEPFSLIIFDHHTDMQKPMVTSMMSCGDWAGLVLDNNKYLKNMVLVGPSKKDIEEIEASSVDKLIAYSAEELRNPDKTKEELEAKLKINFNIPVYISIDKDVLDEKISETNWNQGHMSLSMLESILKNIIRKCKVIGIDICGECDRNISLPEYMEAEEKNGELNEELYEFLTKMLRGRR